jgi:hypothetical protein
LSMLNPEPGFDADWAKQTIGASRHTAKVRRNNARRNVDIVKGLLKSDGMKFYAGRTRSANS